MKNFIKINRALAAEKKLFVVLCASLVCAMNVLADATDTKSVDCGKTVTIAAEPLAGFHFTKWTKDGEDFDGNTAASIEIENIKAAVTYVAHFEADDQNFGDDVTGEDENGDPLVWPVNHGTTIYLRAEVDDCHTFHWSDVNDPEDPNYAINPRPFVYEGVAPGFTAVLDIIMYDVKVEAENGNGNVTVTIVEP